MRKQFRRKKQMMTTNNNLTTFYCKHCGAKIAFIFDGSKLKKGVVFLCKKCYDLLESGNLFGNIFK